MKKKTKQNYSSKNYTYPMNERNGFTLIELIVVMSIVAVLVLLGGPKFLNKTQDAHHTKHVTNAKLLEEAAERFYADHGEWPKLVDVPYSKEAINSYSEKLYDSTGEVIVLDDGDYYDIDYVALSKYVKLPSMEDTPNYILHNPIGKVYYLSELSDEGKEREPEPLIKEFSYTGSAQSVDLPKGTYQLEVWGGQGGNGYNESVGGYGGYSKGIIKLTHAETLYIYVAGQGGRWNSVPANAGGFNGGGNGNGASGAWGGAGGGATHISKRTGLLSELNSHRTDIYIVAGGGAGGGHRGQSGDSAGTGGGLSGGVGGAGRPAGTQDSGFQFGRGQNSTGHDMGAGGGGWFGGYASTTNDRGGSGGSSYIGGVIDGTTSSGVQTGNGKAKVTQVFNK